MIYYDHYCIHLCLHRGVIEKRGTQEVDTYLRLIITNYFLEIKIFHRLNVFVLQQVILHLQLLQKYCLTSTFLEHEVNHSFFCL